MIKDSNRKYKTPRIKRYTDLPFLLYLLQTGKLTLLSPKYWDDKHDIHYLEEYVKRKELKSVLALCFAEKKEQYHHWKIFSGNSSGVCIVFNKEKLLNNLGSDIQSNYVAYKKIKDAYKEKIKLDELPFLKRDPCEDEGEFRLIYASKTEILEFKDFDIEIEAIEEIILNPWLPKSVVPSIIELIRSIPNARTDKSIKIYQTTLTSNEDWEKIADSAE